MVGSGLMGDAGNEDGRGKKLVVEFLRIGPARCKVNGQKCALVALVERGAEQLHRNQNPLAGLGIIHQFESLQALAQGYAPSVEIHNLGHGFAARGPGLKLEPDVRAGQIVAMQTLRYLNPLAKPDRIFGVLAARPDSGPRGIIEVEALAMRQIAGVQSPFSIGNAIQLPETRDDLLRRSRQGLGGGDLLGRLRPRHSRKQKPNCRNSAKSFLHQEANPSYRSKQRGSCESRRL